jgi:hypothetical protein
LVVGTVWFAHDTDHTPGRRPTGIATYSPGDPFRREPLPFPLSFHRTRAMNRHARKSRAEKDKTT